MSTVVPPGQNPWTYLSKDPNIQLIRGEQYPGNWPIRSNCTITDTGDANKPIPWVRGPLSGDGGVHDIQRKENVFIKNVKFDGLKGDKTTWLHYGMKFVYCNNIRLEGIKVVNFNGNGITFEGTEGKRVSGFSLRNSYIANNWPKDESKHCQGLYSSYSDNCLLEGNTFHENGGKPGTETMFNQNCYLNGMCGAWRVVGNLFSRASNTGLQQRCGGENRWNLFVNNALHMTYGLVNRDYVHPGGVTGVVERNLYYGGKMMNTTRQGWALDVGQVSKTAPGVTVRDILMIKAVNQTSPMNIKAGQTPMKNPGAIISPSQYQLKIENIFADSSWGKSIISVQDNAKVVKGNNAPKIVSGNFDMPADYVEQCKNNPARIKELILAGFAGYGITIPTT